MTVDFAYIPVPHPVLYAGSVFRNLVKEIDAVVVFTSFDGGISVITLAVLDVQSEYPGEKG